MDDNRNKVIAFPSCKDHCPSLNWDPSKPDTRTRIRFSNLQLLEPNQNLYGFSTRKKKTICEGMRDARIGKGMTGLEIFFAEILKGFLELLFIKGSDTR